MTHPEVLGFDLRQGVGAPTGVGRYLIGLANAAAHHLGADVRAYVRSGDVAGLSGDVSVVRVNRAGLSWHRAVAAEVRRHRATYISTSLVIPQLPGIRALPVVLDLTTVVVPEYHTARNRWIERLLLPRAIRRHRVVTCTHATARDLGAYVRGVQEITVVPPNLPAPQVHRGGEPADRYVLFVGTLEPRKNLPTALRAVDLVRSTGRALRIVVVGKIGWHAGPIRAALEDATRRGVAEWRGFVSDAERDELYAGSMAVLVPSVYEGFGLPLLEGMARGVPCICSDTPALVEVSGGAAEHVPIFAADRWAEALTRLYDSPALRNERSRLGVARGRTFTPHMTARALAAALEWAASPPSSI